MTETFVANLLVHTRMFTDVRIQALVDIAQRLIGEIATVVATIAKEIFRNTSSIFALIVSVAAGHSRFTAQFSGFVRGIRTIWSPIAG